MGWGGGGVGLGVRGRAVAVLSFIKRGLSGFFAFTCWDPFGLFQRECNDKMNETCSNKSPLFYPIA